MMTLPRASDEIWYTLAFSKYIRRLIFSQHPDQWYYFGSGPLYPSGMYARGGSFSYRSSQML